MTKKFNTTGRLFTFGTSNTQYYWPTWADIVGTCWKEFENWGRLGTGNLYIFNSIIECDARNNFNENDTVLIRWAPISRIDYYQYNNWGTILNKFPTKNQPDYPASCAKGYEIITYAYIRAINNFLKLKKVEFNMWSPESNHQDSEIIKFYSSDIDRLESLSRMNKYSLMHSPKTLKESMFSIFEDTAIDLQKKLYIRLSGPSWPPLEDILNNSYSATPAIQIEIDEFLKILENDKKINSLNFKHDLHPSPLGFLKLIQISDYLKDLTIPDATIQWVKELDQKLTHGEKITFNPNIPKHRL
jgi:hypothetical protein